MSIQNIIVDVVALSGGRVVGRTRVQKTIYLLDTLGLNSGAAFYYYNFGPFSDEVADGISDGKFSGSLVERVGHRQSDGSPFSVFETQKNSADVPQLGDIDRDHARRLLERLQSVNSTVLELAATVHWLRFIEKVDDWRAELRRRKGAKTDGGRMDQAAALLGELGITL
jgi:uncharacterized protein YwgA